MAFSVAKAARWYAQVDKAGAVVAFPPPLVLPPVVGRIASVPFPMP